MLIYAGRIVEIRLFFVSHRQVRGPPTAQMRYDTYLILHRRKWARYELLSPLYDWSNRMKMYKSPTERFTRWLIECLTLRVSLNITIKNLPYKVKAVLKYTCQETNTLISIKITMHVCIVFMNCKYQSKELHILQYKPYPVEWHISITKYLWVLLLNCWGRILWRKFKSKNFACFLN